MGEGSANRVRANDELSKLAGAVVRRIRLSRFDRAELQDVFQTAYIAGLTAERSAHLSNRRASAEMLKLAMQEAAMRMLRRARRGFIEADFEIYV